MRHWGVLKLGWSLASFSSLDLKPQKQIPSSPICLAVHPPTLHLPPSLPAHPLPHLVLLLLSSTYLAVLHGHAVDNSTHLIIFPLDPVQSAPAAFRIFSLHSFPLFVLYAMDTTRAIPFPALHQQPPSKAPHPKPARFLTLTVFWGCRDEVSCGSWFVRTALLCALLRDKPMEEKD